MSDVWRTAGRPNVMLAHTRPLACRVEALQDATAEVRIVRLAIVGGGAFRFAPGQYARVAFGDQAPRPFSMASRPDEEHLEFHVRHASNGGASAYAARQLRRGDGVWVEGPYGDAWLRPDHRGPIVAIAGGTGLAPMKSIVGAALAARRRAEVHLYFGARDEGGIYLEDYFRQLESAHRSFRYVPALSHPGAASGRHVPAGGESRRRSGLVTDAVAADFASLAGAKAYLAGPPAMVEAAVRLLLTRGMARCDIHGDAYSVEAARPAPLDAALGCGTGQR